MRVHLSIALTLLYSFFVAGTAMGDTTKQYSGAPVEFLGSIKERADLSAIGRLHSFLLIGSDEAVGKKSRKKNVVQLLRPDGENRYVYQAEIPLCDPMDAKGNCKKKKHRKEMDIEGIAVEGDTVYVIGSHSAVRKRVRCEPIGGCTLDCRKPRTYSENRAILSGSTKGRSSSRERLVRFSMSSRGIASNMEEISLGSMIDRLPLFQHFSQIPGKENGVDIEGVAVRDGIVHVGFRGPVLRGNYVPILKLRFDRPSVSERDIVFVKLGGRGIRALARVSDGFLILAGPVGGGSDSFQLYHWDGGDMVPGGGPRPAPPGKLKLLGAISHPPCSNPEGISVQRENAASYDIIVVFDGSSKDVAHRFTIASKP